MVTNSSVMKSRVTLYDIFGGEPTLNLHATSLHPNRNIEWSMFKK